MKEHTEHQIIQGPDGRPLFAVVPYGEYLRLIGRRDEPTFPHEVVGANVIDGKSLIRAWREYKKITQQDMAEKMGITQAAYSQMERPDSRLRRVTLKKIAAALGVDVDQLMA